MTFVAALTSIRADPYRWAFEESKEQAQKIHLYSGFGSFVHCQLNIYNRIWCSSKFEFYLNLKGKSTAFCHLHNYYQAHKMNTVAMRVPVNARLTMRRMSSPSGMSSPKTSGFMGQKLLWQAHIAAGKFFGCVRYTINARQLLKHLELGIYSIFSPPSISNTFCIFIFL